LFFLGGTTYFATRWIQTRSATLRHLVYATAGLAWMLVFLDVYLFDSAPPLVTGCHGWDVFVSYWIPWCLFTPTVCAIALVDINHQRFTAPLALLGNISYSVYLIHFPLMMLCFSLCGHGILPENFWQEKGFFLIFSAGLLALSFASFEFLEKPVQHYLRTRWAADRSKRKDGAA